MRVSSKEANSMTKRIVSTELIRVAVVSQSPVRPSEQPIVRTIVDRNFGLPSGLYIGTVGAYFAFLAVMAAAFMTGELILPMAICAIFVTMAFGVPMLWTRMKREDAGAPLSWGQFANRGILTHTGRLTAGEASVQVLILPVLILFWGVCITVIVALT
jgi:Flp pilus assembly protein TadB